MEDKDSKKMKTVFSDDDDSVESDDINQLHVNKEYKENFEKRKQRQELARARELGIDLSEDSSTEDEGQELTFKKEAEILNVIQMIKNHDPKIHDKDFKPFENMDSDEEVKDQKKSKKKLTAKDMIREQVLSGKIESDEESDDTEKPPKSFAQEMQELKDEVLQGIKEEEDHIEDGDSGDEFFTKRDNAEEDTALFEEYIEKNVDEEKKERVKGFLDSNPEDEKERFLLDYVKNMRWKEEGDDYVPSYMEIVGDEAKGEEDLEEDIKDIDQQDRFEHLFNTRFEQDNLVMYPR